MNLICAQKSIVLLLTALFAFRQSSGHHAGTEFFEHLRPWLPLDTEIVYVSSLPLHGVLLADAQGHPSNQYGQLAAAATAGMVYVPPKLKNVDIESAVYIGRRFETIRGHKGLGLVGSLEGCSFLRSRDAAVAATIRQAQSDLIVSTSGVAIYRLGSSEVGNAILISAPEPGLLMICNDMGLATDVLQRRELGSSSRTYYIDENLRRYVHTDASVWGVRRFPGDTKDPTSPRGGASEVFQGYKDSEALGMTFAMRSDSLATITYISHSHEAAKIYERSWGLPSTTSLDGDLQVVTMKFDPSMDQGDTAARIFLTLLGLLISL